MFYPSTTIAAISTPLAAGGIGIVRISGEKALEIGGRVFRPANGKKLGELPGYRGLFGRVADREGEFDEAVAFVYRAPKSYTGEDTVELCCHGGLYLVQRTLRACLDAGAAGAQAGEFTRRALLNGKMSLTQAEAVADLIAAQGRHSAQAALGARDGAVYREIHRISQRLLELSAALAVWVDYPDEEPQEVSGGRLERAVEELSGELSRLVRDYDNGRVFREGVDTVIVGRPNVGKSTLMNLLAGAQKSIVTQIPGTTRDIVEDTIRLGEVVLHLADTAGLRQTDDPVERLGVELASQRLERSFLALAVFDSSDPLTQQDRELLSRLQGRPAVAVINKTDLERRIDVQEVRRSVPVVVELSAAQGGGVEELSQAVLQVLSREGADPTAGLLANERQRGCAVQALESIRQAGEALSAGETLDAVGVCIDEAVDALLSLTGEKATDAVVDEVFRRFCVGK